MLVSATIKQSQQAKHKQLKRYHYLQVCHVFANKIFFKSSSSTQTRFSLISSRNVSLWLSDIHFHNEHQFHNKCNNLCYEPGTRTVFWGPNCMCCGAW